MHKSSVAVAVAVRVAPISCSSKKFLLLWVARSWPFLKVPFANVGRLEHPVGGLPAMPAQLFRFVFLKTTEVK